MLTGVPLSFVSTLFDVLARVFNPLLADQFSLS